MAQYMLHAQPMYNAFHVLIQMPVTLLIALQLEGNSLTVPEGVPIYDLQTDIPWFFENHTPWADLVKRTLETDPELVQLLMSPEQPIPYPEAKSILRWETNMVRTAHKCRLRHDTSLHSCNALNLELPDCSCPKELP